MPFDYLKPGSAGFYLFSARIVRLRLKDGSMETFITNLNQTQFPPAALCCLYARCWGVETSFRQLKYTVGMVHLHSKWPELILQEILSAFIIFNFTKAAAWEVDTAWGSSKYKRRVNFSDAVYLCCQTLRAWFLDVLPLLERKLLPCRPDRRFPRPIIAENRISPMYVPSRYPSSNIATIWSFLVNLMALDRPGRHPDAVCHQMRREHQQEAGHQHRQRDQDGR